jgi:hypothetical protein
MFNIDICGRYFIWQILVFTTVGTFILLTLHIQVTAHTYGGVAAEVTNDIFLVK